MLYPVELYIRKIATGSPASTVSSDRGFNLLNYAKVAEAEGNAPPSRVSKTQVITSIRNLNKNVNRDYYSRL